MKILNWIKNFFNKNDFSKKTVETVKKVRVRARDARGRFKADDPKTKENEAYTYENRSDYVGRD
tara:strand:+ start:793 stop:984 length:192 start_codon:yes stop_codon:yes gene_type:complete